MIALALLPAQPSVPPIEPLGERPHIELVSPLPKCRRRVQCFSQCAAGQLDTVPAMPDIPWTAAAEMEPGHEYLVMASHLPLQRITSTLRFFRAVAAIRTQLRSAEGLVGYTLRAKPLTRDYWTLSVWKDVVALEQFMRTPPHVGVMSSLKPHMGPTKFGQWKITSSDGRPDWAEALERLTRE